MPPFNENQPVNCDQATEEKEIGKIIDQISSITLGPGHSSIVEELIMRAQTSLTKKYGEDACDKIIAEAQKRWGQQIMGMEPVRNTSYTDSLQNVKPFDPNTHNPSGKDFAGNQGEEE